MSPAVLVGVRELDGFGRGQWIGQGSEETQCGRPGLNPPSMDGRRHDRPCKCLIGPSRSRLLPCVCRSKIADVGRFELQNDTSSEQDSDSPRPGALGPWGLGARWPLWPLRAPMRPAGSQRSKAVLSLHRVELFRWPCPRGGGRPCVCPAAQPQPTSHMSVSSATQLQQQQLHKANKKKNAAANPRSGPRAHSK